MNLQINTQEFKEKGFTLVKNFIDQFPRRTRNVERFQVSAWSWGEVAAGIGAGAIAIVDQQIKDENESKSSKTKSTVPS